MKLEDAIQSHNFTSEKQKAGLHILFTAYQLKCEVSAILKPFDLTAEQYNVLRILKGKHPQNMCVKDIAGRMIERSSNVPRIIDRLVYKKLVKRSQSKEDKRETMMILTDKGLALLESSSQKMNETFDGILRLSNEESKILNDLLEKVNKEQ
ncbi:MarR family winged helix-turn-helix transcriptional regulator [Ilyomonas limi]|uniref:MarR family winged helix-turn-helix transcriptional regulator n=1 Tax=Ilyomonas limi TaxID=2575867 RepID=UPI00148541F7|nr:MarR family transcriptional regulator [Ilyomonas limi]